VTEENKNLPQLPKGWVWTRMQDICETTSGGTPSRKNKSFFGGEIPWLKSGELDSQFINSAEESITKDGLMNSSAKVIPKGALLIALYGATVGKLGILGIDAAINQAICAISPYEGIYPKFLFWYLSQYRNELLNVRKGGAQPNISQEIVRNILIPLAPFPEQRRIVAKIEEFFTNLDAGVESLKKVKAQLKRYRQAVLKYAFEGKLTEEWRKTHKDEVEPASVLLKRIKEEQKKNAQGKYKEFPPIDPSDLPQLPDIWVWTTVGQLYDIVGGGTPSTGVAEYWNGDIAWITSADIHGLKDVRPRKYVTKNGIDNSATNLVPEGSLIVVTRVGLGKVALTKTPMCFSQDSQALVGNSSLLYPEYSLYYLSKAVQIFKYKHRGTTIAGVTKKQLGELPFPLSPLSEQRKIVEEFERRFSVADEVEKVVEQRLRQAERLRQSVLKSAFEGRLVHQDPSDEPANKLLERIKEERAKRKAEENKKKDNVRESTSEQVELTRYVK
jgi:type I restriction enzyme S subunit